MDYLISELGGSASTIGRQAVNQVRNNIFPRVGKELRENIVPKLEQKGKELKERWIDTSIGWASDTHRFIDLSDRHCRDQS